MSRSIAKLNSTSKDIRWIIKYKNSSFTSLTTIMICTEPKPTDLNTVKSQIMSFFPPNKRLICVMLGDIFTHTFNVYFPGLA